MFELRRTTRIAIVLFPIAVAGCGGSTVTEGTAPNETADPTEDVGAAQLPGAQVIAKGLEGYFLRGPKFFGRNKTYPRYDGSPVSNAEAKVEGLSWRVQILPFIGHQELYDRFDHNESWDSPTNRALIAKMPDCFACDGVSEAGHTAFHVFVADDPEGKQTAFIQYKGVNWYDKPPCRKLDDFIDGVAFTALVVQAGVDTATPWTQPSYLTFDDVPLQALKVDPSRPLSIITADFAVHSLPPKRVTDKFLFALLTPSGREGDILQAIDRWIEANGQAPKEFKKELKAKLREQKKGSALSFETELMRVLTGTHFE